MDCAHATFVTRVHRVQKFHRFTGTNLPDDDAVWTKTKSTFQKIFNRNFTFALSIGLTSFKHHHVFVLNLQLRRVFNYKNALAFWNA
ncbi:hypothetical protein D3C87_1410460 [compost metagenome]